MEFFSNGKGEVRFIGYSLFETDKRGIYKENLLATDDDILGKLSAYVPASVFRLLCRRLTIELAHTIGEYEGYLGSGHDDMPHAFGEDRLCHSSLCGNKSADEYGGSGPNGL